MNEPLNQLLFCYTVMMWTNFYNVESKTKT